MEILQHGCSIIGLIISIIIVAFADKLKKDKCKCIKDWRHNYVKGFAIVTIVLTLVLCGKNIFMPGKLVLSKMLSKVVYALLTVYMIASVVNIFALFTYTQKLGCRNECLSCRSKNQWMMDFLYYYSMIVAVLYFIVIVFSIILGVMAHTNPKLMTGLKTALAKRK